MNLTEFNGVILTDDYIEENIDECLKWFDSNLDGELDVLKLCGHQENSGNFWLLISCFAV